MKRMKRGKAVGLDDIPVEAWKAVGRTAVEWLTAFRKIMETEHMPGEWTASTLIPIFKNKGDIQDGGNYRGIKLTSHTLNMWERITDKRLRNRVEVSEHNSASCPTESQRIFALHQVVEKYREEQEEFHCIFTDLDQAYDRVSRREVWCYLRLKDVEEKYIRLVQDMCEIIIDCMTGEVQREAPWDMLLADDVVMSAETKEEAEQRLELRREAMEVRGMKASRQKTEYLKIKSGDEEKKEGGEKGSKNAR
ncbi:uncharacterized protein LOC134785798 [Penaeus indicus]|uniref:uncharacterized protein LOC134785798 n=1 Tax=Penaeus indicus TaxID=29960 RepID=UPI00300C614B